MSDHEDHDFDQGDSGASETFPLQCSALRKGGFVMIKVSPNLVLGPAERKILLMLYLHFPEQAVQDRGDVYLKDWQAWPRQGSHGCPGHFYR